MTRFQECAHIWIQACRLAAPWILSINIQPQFSRNYCRWETWKSSKIRIHNTPDRFSQNTRIMPVRAVRGQLHIKPKKKQKTKHTSRLRIHLHAPDEETERRCGAKLYLQLLSTSRTRHKTRQGQKHSTAKGKKRSALYWYKISKTTAVLGLRTTPRHSLRCRSLLISSFSTSWDETRIIGPIVTIARGAAKKK